MATRLRYSRLLLAAGLILGLATAAVLARGRSDEPAAIAPAAEDDRLEATEDVELLDAYTKAKSAQLRQADQKVALAKAYLTDAKTKQTTGYFPRAAVSERELQVLDAETDRAFRAAELKDFEVRLARARRRLAALGPAEARPRDASP